LKDWISRCYRVEKTSSFLAYKCPYHKLIGYNTGMRSLPVSLPSDPQQLQKICTQLQAQLADQGRVIEAQQKTLDEHTRALLAKQDTIDYLTEQLILLRSKRYQAQSEQLKTLQGQLFDEAELEVAIREAEAALAELRTDPGPTLKSERTPAKARPKRKPIPEHLKRVDIVIDVSDAEQAFPYIAERLGLTL
jgi:transposase